MMRFQQAVGALLSALVAAYLAVPAAASAGCRDVPFALSDAKDVAALKGAIERACPCASFDGSSPALRHPAYVRCASGVIRDASDGTPVLGAYTLRPECRMGLRRVAAMSRTVAPDKLRHPRGNNTTGPPRDSDRRGAPRPPPDNAQPRAAPRSWPPAGRAPGLWH